MNAQRLLSIIILTHQEEANIGVCLESLRELDAEVFIVDSGSTDGTVAVAGRTGCHITAHAFENYARQLNWALDTLPVETPWVMRLDADERLTPELVEELKLVLASASPDVNGLMVKRRVYFWGRWIRHGGYYPTWLLRIWRRGKAHCEQRWMDEHMALQGGTILKLQHDIIDENHKGLGFWTDKHNRYADREVKDLLAQESGAPDVTASLNAPLEGQPVRRRWMKQNLYARLPLFLRALLYWCYRYFVLLGFLDGRPGLVFHFLQGFWYRFLVDAKLEEIKRHPTPNRAMGKNVTELVSGQSSCRKS